MSKNLAITVLTWNDLQNTIKFLESIYQSTFDNFDIILVNNNSKEIHLQKIFDWSKNNIKIEDEEITYNPNKKIEIIKVEKNTIIKNKGKR